MQSGDRPRRKISAPPSLGFGETPGDKFVTKLMDFYKDHKCDLLLPQHTGRKMIAQAKEKLQTMSALEEISISEKEDIVIVGDIHGQVFDLINMLDLFDEPGSRHKYIFNGDFVDRGQWGTEVLFILLGYFLSCPGSVWLLRGNHEEDTINSLYGFRDEVMEKYDMEMYLEIQDLFRHLPVAATVNEKVFVSHGGIGSGLFSLADLRSLEDRQGLASMSGVLGDLLWSDPGPEDGTSDNIRGVSVVWGPDVTQSFLASNSLELIIRSHECVMTGYTRCHDDKVVTVFSAPNYCDLQGNLGAVVTIRGGEVTRPDFRVFDKAPHP